MMELLKSIITDVLHTLYQSFWFSALLAFLFMFAYKRWKEDGVQKAVGQWIDWFRTESEFRRVFLLALYSSMVLYRTLFNRNLWLNPLVNIFGSWGFYDMEGKFTAEVAENVILFMPLIFLLFLCFRERLLPDPRFGKILRQSMRISFLCSMVIEFLQLFLHLGTWQVSDVFYNTLGGMLGGMIYWMSRRTPKRKRERERCE